MKKALAIAGAFFAAFFLLRFFCCIFCEMHTSGVKNDVWYVEMRVCRRGMHTTCGIKGRLVCKLKK